MKRTHNIKVQKERQMSFYHFDIRGFPMVRVMFHRSPVDQKEVDAFVQELSKLYQRQKPFQMLVDTKNLAGFSSRYMYSVAHFMKTHEAQTKLYLTQTAVVVHSMFVRGILNLLWTLQKPVSRLETFDNSKAAATWLNWI